MGCFSYLCKVCNKPINSNSSTGQKCRLYFLKEGVIIEEMHGQYDSYGTVFCNEENSDSFEWKTDWSEMVSLHFNEKSDTGMAAIHEHCYYPGFEKDLHDISGNDNNQGWGKYTIGKIKQTICHVVH